MKRIEKIGAKVSINLSSITVNFDIRMTIFEAYLYYTNERLFFMKVSKAREQILGRIRKGLSTGSFPLPFPEVDKDDARQYFEKSDMSKEEWYATEFIKLGGKFVFCENEQDFVHNLIALAESKDWKDIVCTEPAILDLCQQQQLEWVHSFDSSNSEADASITGCELLVARTGSTIFSSKQHMGRIAPVYYPAHIIVAYMDQVVEDLPDGLQYILDKYKGNLPSMINLNSGPSRTADIEKTLVVGGRADPYRLIRMNRYI